MADFGAMTVVAVASSNSQSHAVFVQHSNQAAWRRHAPCHRVYTLCPAL